MNKTEVIQRIIDKIKGRSYLEIGVDYARNFFAIKALQKVAVDPTFTFTKENKKKWRSKNWYNWLARYYEITSDEYFARKKPRKRFDVIFVDGLHNYEQSLRDIINSLNCLHKKGVIVMHDCNPPHAAAAHPANSIKQASELNVPGWTGEWCGDVWKTICYLRSQRKDLQVFVLDCDYGLGIVTRGEADSYLDLNEEEINKMTYKDLASNRKSFLNLKDETYIDEFIQNIRPIKRTKFPW